MNYVVGYSLYAIKMIGFIAFLPFLIPAFFIAKMMGADAFSLDGMGIGFLFTVIIAGALAIGAGFFFLGTLF